MIAIGAKNIRLIFYFSLLLSLVFPNTGMALGPDNDDDNDGNEPPVIDLRKILQVQDLNIPLLTGEQNVDGLLDEPFWAHSQHYEIKLETYPALLEPSPVNTDVFLAQIKDYLVVGFIAYDPEPKKIQAPLRDRDSIEFDDYVGFSIDLSGNFLTKYEFYVSARGVQGDWVRNNIDEIRSRDWDAEWESAAKIGGHGYTVEMRIPLSELEIPTKVTQKRFVLFKRHYPREIRHHLNVITESETDESNKKLINKFVIVPSLTLLNEQSSDPVQGTDWEADYKSQFSLDIGYKFTPSLGLLATYNPNFLEVEADLVDWSINDPFTPLVFERRPFFTRGVETFATPFDLVYTRNIEDPDAGLKVAGLVSDLTTGNFIVNDQELSLIVPGNLSSERVDLDMESTSSAFRYRYDFSPGMSAGVIATGRTNGADYHNGVAGLDLYTRFNPANELRAQWVYSETLYPDEIVNELCGDDDGCNDPQDTPGVPGHTPFNEQVLRADPSKIYNDDALLVKYKYNQRKGYFIARYLDIGEDFRADLGYMTRIDYRLIALTGGLNHYTEIKDKGQIRFRPSVNFLRQESQAGELINESREIWLNHWGLFQSWVRIGFRNRERTARRFLQNTLKIDKNSPRFTENQLEFRFEGTPMKNFRFIFAGKLGTQIDTDNYRLGDILEIKPELRMHITDQIELGISNTYRQLNVEGGRLFTENYLGVNVIYHFIKGSFIRLTIIDDYLHRDPGLYLFEEVDSLERETTGELLFAWKPSKLNSLLVGMKTGAIDNDALNNLELEAMSFYIKYSRAFRF